MDIGNRKNKQIKRKKPYIVILLVVWLFFRSQMLPVYGAEVEVRFDSQEYFVEKNEEFVIAVSIQAEEQIGTYYVELRYDSNRMEYQGGGDAAAQDIIRLEGTGVRQEINYFLHFKAVDGGNAGILVQEARIQTAGEQVEDFSAMVRDSASVLIAGEDESGASFIPLLGAIHSAENEQYYIVDAARYTPDCPLWNYKLTQEVFDEREMMFLTDQTENVRILPMRNAEEEMQLYAYNPLRQEFYPVQTMELQGEQYFYMSTKACRYIPEQLETEEADRSRVMFAINSEGMGDFYEYTEAGELIVWSAEAEEPISGLSILESLILELPMPEWFKPLFGLLILLFILSVLALYYIRHFVKVEEEEYPEQISHRSGGHYPLRTDMEYRRQYFFAIRELTTREIKRKYARSYLGIVWSVLNPLLTMAVMSLIFSTMFRRSIENFPIYYLTGSIFWTLFSGTTNSAMTSLVDNKSLLLKVKLPRQTFVLSRVYTSLVNFGYTFLAYILMLLVFRIKPSWTMLLFPIDVLLALLFALGIGYILSIVYVFFADIKYLYGILLTLWMYLSAVFYPVDALPKLMQTLIGFNPVYLSIYIARESILYGRLPDPMAWIKLAMAAGISCMIGLRVFRRNQNMVMQRM